MTVMEAVMQFGGVDSEVANSVSKHFSKISDALHQFKDYGVCSRDFSILFKICCKNNPSILNETARLIDSGSISRREFFENLSCSNPKPFVSAPILLEV